MTDLPLFVSTTEEENFKLKQQLVEAEQRIAELKAHVNKQGEYIEMLNTHLYMEYGEEFQFTDLPPKQSLAEHDKNNLIAFVSDVNETGQFGWTDCQWLTDYVEEYMEQLKDSNNE